MDQAPPPDLAAQRTALEVAAITLGLAGLVAIGTVVIGRAAAALALGKHARQDR